MDVEQKKNHPKFCLPIKQVSLNILPLFYHYHIEWVGSSLLDDKYKCNRGLQFVFIYIRATGRLYLGK